MPKIPFKFLPGSWGLVGKTREIAKAEYELSGYDLEYKLLTLRQDEIAPSDYKRKMAELELKYERVTKDHYHRCLADLIDDPIKRELALLEIDYRAGIIKEVEYNKSSATLKNEPWVTVINMDFTKGTSLEGNFELDWNDAFVKKLESEGYVGVTPDATVNQWFMEVCRNVAMEEFDGTGDFAADSEANLETVKRWSSKSESISKGRKGYT